MNFKGPTAVVLLQRLRNAFPGAADFRCRCRARMGLRLANRAPLAGDNYSGVAKVLDFVLGTELNNRETSLRAILVEFGHQLVKGIVLVRKEPVAWRRVGERLGWRIFGIAGVTDAGTVALSDLNRGAIKAIRMVEILLQEIHL